MANIQWFPGHMTKAKRQMEQNLKLVDFVIELRDARIPYSSRNPMLEEMMQNKPRLIILSKKDKADPVQTERWIEKLASDQEKVLALDLIHDAFKKQVSDCARELCRPFLERQKRRGMKPRPLRAMVCGIPNVGKSTFINSIAKRKAAQTANRPGVTKSLQWIRFGSDIELLDTPGVLWPKFDNQVIAKKLALCGSIKEDVLPVDEVVNYALMYLSENYPELLKDRYNITDFTSADVIINQIAANRNCLDANGGLDLDKATLLVFREIKNGTLGNISWEKPDEDSK